MFILTNLSILNGKVDYVGVNGAFSNPKTALLKALDIVFWENDDLIKDLLIKKFNFDPATYTDRQIFDSLKIVENSDGKYFKYIITFSGRDVSDMFDEYIWLGWDVLDGNQSYHACMIENRPFDDYPINL